MRTSCEIRIPYLVPNWCLQCILYCEMRTPLNKGYVWLVPRVSLFHRFHCIGLLPSNKTWTLSLYMITKVLQNKKKNTNLPSQSPASLQVIWQSWEQSVSGTQQHMTNALQSVLYSQMISGPQCIELACLDGALTQVLVRKLFPF
jgi:hypothetical protein